MFVISLGIGRPSVNVAAAAVVFPWLLSTSLEGYRGASSMATV